MQASLKFATTVAALATASLGQTPIFVRDSASIPAGGLSFNSYQSDLGDVDRDGDPDIAIAIDTGTTSSQNRLWLNEGGLQGGTPGIFVDASAARFPASPTHAYDLDFADYDRDGDLDLHLSALNDTSRWWTNMGGAQGGTAGFFQDETTARWLDLDAGSTSIASSQVLATGGFLDWSWDGEFADLDGDGELDLVHTAVHAPGSNQPPTRMFLDDGSGAFREFNPSGFRLSGPNIASGNPGLWCEGVQATDTLDATGAQCDVTSDSFESEVGDFDGDFDLDFLQGGQGVLPRFFRNRLAENGGVLSFRDETGAVFAPGYAGQGGYGQGIADLDADGDLDIYGLNWLATSSDHTLENDGTGSFAIGTLVPDSGDDEEDADFLDYDDDGDLDVVLAGYIASQELYRNELGGAGGFTKVSSLVQSDTNFSYDNDVADTDLDGDPDFIVSSTATIGFFYFRNTSQVADTHAPAIPALEQAPDRPASTAAMVVRCYVYDNTSDYVVAAYDVALEYAVNGGAFASTPMRWVGAQVFRGEIPGQVSGSIAYRVRATDRSGNAGLSSVKSFVSSGFVTYCTAGVTTNACAGSMGAAGTPSASSGAGFTLLASSLEGQKPGLFFYGVDGRAAQPWGTSTSYLCVRFPVQRTTLLNSAGSSGACDGSFALDWNAWIAANPTALGQPLAPGTVVDAQAWFRDPPSAKTTALTDALEFVVGP